MKTRGRMLKVTGAPDVLRTSRNVKTTSVVRHALVTPLYFISISATRTQIRHQAVALKPGPLKIQFWS